MNILASIRKACRPTFETLRVLRPVESKLLGLATLIEYPDGQWAILWYVLPDGKAKGVKMRTLIKRVQKCDLADLP